MLKREITYKNVDGDTITDTFYFNISQTELIELEVENKNGLTELIKQIVATDNRKELVALLKKIVLLSVGKRSEDGKRFIKNDEIREEFSQMNAFDVLFMEMAINEGKASEFIKGALPSEMPEDLNKSISEAAGAATGITPPTPPVQ